MREFSLLAIAAAAGLVGMGVGHLLLSKKHTPTVAVVVPSITTTESAPPITKITLQATPTEPVDYGSSPEAIHAWRRADKEEFKQRVDRLNNSDAEHICFVLQLIPRDEVFDKINVKGRLRRHIDDMYAPGEFTEIETAFRELNDRR